MAGARSQLENKNPEISESLLTSFILHLQAEHKKETTIAHYAGATKQFLDFCTQERLPDITRVSREHVELWLVSLHKTYAPASVKNRYIGLRIFFKWLEDEDEIQRNPMARIKPPSLPESPKDVVEEDDLLKVLRYLDKQKRYRDCALVAVVYDTGMRATEIADCETAACNLVTGLIVIPKTKNNRIRTVHLSAEAIRYLDRYLRRPRKDPRYLFNGRKGKLTRSGVYDAIRRCFAELGLTAVIGPHDLRHTSATHVAGELPERELMTLYGWTDPDMARHYTQKALTRVAIDAHKRASPLGKLLRG